MVMLLETSDQAATALVVQELFGLTAWETFTRLAGLPHVLYLDSAAALDLGRYSYVTADPCAWIWPPSGLVNNVPIVMPPADPFDCLADALARFQTETLPGLPPFQGGAAGLFAYDLCHYLERLPRPRHYDFAIPDMAVGLYDWVVSFDHHEEKAWLVSTGFPEMDPRRRRRRAAERREMVLRLLDGNGVARRAGDVSPPSQRPASASVLTRGTDVPRSPGHLVAPRYPVVRPGLFSNFDRATYLNTARRAIDYVHAGDCFQVNVAQRLLFPLREPPIELYERLRLRNPAPFAGYFDLGGLVIASASPERFLRLEPFPSDQRGDEEQRSLFRPTFHLPVPLAPPAPWRGGLVSTHPIKGTAPRGATPEADRALAEALLASTKDRAENVMIVDLLRNDLGRVCEYGSVRVEALCRLESYRHVHHLVSEVRGRLRPGLGPVDLLRAAFPGGSVTGAPKIRAMEIITELEQTARGAYCGSLGYIGFDGSMDTNLLIRTFTIGQGWAHFAVGGGIVADSDPEREYEETWHKAEGMLRALE